jgi:dolichol-phosphate mannosyltransferase
MTAKKVVVVVPTYNEKENIVLLIEKILDQAKKIKNLDFQVLISDSHSSDGTQEAIKKAFAENPKVHVLDVSERGIGVGLIKGFDYGVKDLGADILVSMDADFSHDPKDLPKLILPLGPKFNLVIGSRFARGGENRLPFIRRQFAFWANFLARLLLGIWEIREWTTSFRALTSDLYKSIDKERIPWRAKSFVFQTAFLYEALKSGAKIHEVPIIFEDRKLGKAKIQVVRYIFELLKFLLIIRYRKNTILVKFLIVGTIGFIVYSIFMWVFYDSPFLPFMPQKNTTWGFWRLTHADLRLFISSVISIEASIMSNFLWHENWTFKKRLKKGRLVTRFWQFHIIAIGSPLIQLASVNILTPYFGLPWLISSAIGVLIGLTWNYLWNTQVVWRRRPTLTATSY